MQQTGLAIFSALMTFTGNCFGRKLILHLSFMLKIFRIFKTIKKNPLNKKSNSTDIQIRYFCIGLMYFYN